MIKIINSSAESCTEAQSESFDLMLTDPPFDMDGKTLANIINKYTVNHLVLITTMRQLIGFLSESEWKLSFDFVLDTVAPKKSMNIRQPHYTHATGVYLTRNGEKSVFNRKKRGRSDVFSENGYYPTIFRANRERSQMHGHSKNTDTITDLLGSFEVRRVIDIFAGSATTGIAAWELGLDCVLIEKDEKRCQEAMKTFNFLS